jgi:predicted acylesterase/phospholipase RssA
MTFKEAFEKTGIILNISVTDNIHEKCRLLNYLSTPNVFIWSAAIASCSLPFVISPSKIYAKNKNEEIVEWLPMKKGFLDGSIGGDIPRE